MRWISSFSRYAIVLGGLHAALTKVLTVQVRRFFGLLEQASMSVCRTVAGKIFPLPKKMPKVHQFEGNKIISLYYADAAAITPPDRASC
jgi:hypothetical protein